MITEDVKDFIVLLTMGYDSMEGMFSFSLPPGENCSAAWVKPIYVQNHIKNTYGVSYPETAIDLLKASEDDPFTKFVKDICS